MPFDPLLVAEQTDIERAPLEVFINDLPYRTHTKAKNTPSRLTNLVFLGNRSELLQAFAAAGWALADGRDVRALAQSQGYAEAPVSVLLLDGKPPKLVFEKTLNSVNKRHHLRVWQIEETWNGQTVWIATATHDIGLRFSSHKKLTHRVDPNIDQERDKVSDDLRFAGGATVPEMVERPYVPRITQNATGDQMVTDGRAAVLRIKMHLAGYQLEGNLAPRRWRLQPFLSAGGSLTTYQFKNIKLSKRDGVFKFALRRVGTIASAFNSAGVAPLDGGSVFQPPVTYGGGMKLRVTRLLEFQTEYCDNYAKDPDFFNTQSVNLSLQGITSAQDPGSRRHSTYLLSLSFTP